MSQEQYEIEIKSLLGGKEKKDEFLQKIQTAFPQLTKKGRESQLNHYFLAGSPQAIFEKISPLLSREQASSLQRILTGGKNISVRTRKANGLVLLVVKASIDDTTSANGTARIECESLVDLSLEELDNLLIQAGCAYQAKWSRDREEYQLGETTVCIDRNAGYGYLAEFEKIVHNQEEAAAAKTELRVLMGRLGVEELPQDRLERMFAYYNEHWPEYYGTEKIFTVE